jgi:hypothetical protein
MSGEAVKISTPFGMRACAGFVCFGMAVLIGFIVALPLWQVTPASIYLYSTNVAVPRTDLTSRTTTNNYCATLAGRPYLCGPNSAMFISYTTNPISAVVTSPLRPVRGPTGTLIASSFTALLSPSGALTGTIGAALSGTGTCANAWTGMNSTGGGLADTTSNCADFANSGGTLKSGSYVTTTQPWYSQTNGTATCATSPCVICVCY